MGLSDKPLLEGNLVRLRSYTEADHNALKDGFNTVELLRTATGRPAYPNPDSPKVWEWIQEGRKNKKQFYFAIETLDDNTLIGNIDFKNVDFAMRHAELGIAITDIANRGKGYGSDAIRVLLGYGFRELNLHRVELVVNGYNSHALQTYEKLGFVLEATWREARYQDLKYYDVHVLSMLEPEWRKRYWEQA